MLDVPNGYVLIAEDDEDDQFLLVSAFKKVGGEDIELRFVQNGIELLDYLDKCEIGKLAKPNLLIMDLNMPKKDGKTTLAELSSRPYFNSIKVVVFSTTGNVSEINYCAEAGIEGFFVKPASYSELLEIVGKFVKLANVQNN